jgi:hypothetical protein
MQAEVAMNSAVMDVPNFGFIAFKVSISRAGAHGGAQ